MPKYSGDVTLPDGRQFHVVATFTETEPDTNANDMLRADIYTLDGEEVDADVMNEEIPWPNRYDPNAKNYLWSVCVDLVTQQPPDDWDDDYL